MDLALLSKKREQDEPFRILNGNNSQVLKVIKNEGLKCTKGGRYLHLTGKTDRGKAVSLLKNLYNQMFERIKTFGVGDGPNDFPMLEVVDRPFFIEKIPGVNSRLNAWMEILKLIGTEVVI